MPDLLRVAYMKLYTAAVDFEVIGELK